ncbi:MAG: hypothetical protein WD595_04450 [Waddliaceae bacterium]
MAEDKITQIGKIGANTEPLKPTPQKGEFDEVVKQQSDKQDVNQAAPEAQKVEDVAKTAPTLMEEVSRLNSRVDHMTRSSPVELGQQTDDLIAQIDDLKNTLETPDLNIKQSTQTVLRNKIHHIDESLKVALDKAGIEYVQPNQATAATNNPVERFLGLLSHGQDQLQKLSGHIQTIQADPKLQSPAHMLLIQVKVHQIQQEIELFTAMLNKGLESVKTTMNIQV